MEDSLDAIDSCRIEDAGGMARQRCLHAQIHSGARWETVQEGFANGLEYPDRITVRNLDTGDVPTSGYILRRETLPSGVRWVTDSFPGLRLPWLRNEPDSLTLVNDSQGRVVERREYRRGRFSVHHTRWGPWGPVAEIDSSGPIGGPAKQARWDSTHWIDGEITHQILLLRFDSLVERRDSIAWQAGQIVYRAEFLQTPTPQDTPVCVLRYSTDPDGNSRALETCRGVTRTLLFENPSALFVRHRGDTVAVDFGNAGGTRYRYLDSLPGRPPLLLELAVADCNLDGCRDESRSEFTYAVLEEHTGTGERPPRIAFRVQRRGSVVSWVGQIPDGAIVRLLTPRGEGVDRSVFVQGRARIDPSPGNAPFVWTVEHDGRTLGTGSIPLR